MERLFHFFRVGSKDSSDLSLGRRDLFFFFFLDWFLGPFIKLILFKIPALVFFFLFYRSVEIFSFFFFFPVVCLIQLKPCISWDLGVDLLDFIKSYDFFCSFELILFKIPVFGAFFSDRLEKFYFLISPDVFSNQLKLMFHQISTGNRSDLMKFVRNFDLLLFFSPLL